MRFGNLGGRAALLSDEGAIDVAEASNGRFGPDPAGVLDHWDEFRDAAASFGARPVPFDQTMLGPPSPAPRQVFAIGLNYASHASEAGMELPTVPAVFTKFPASLGGPFDDVVLSGEMVDWEVELVVAMGARAHKVPEAEAWDYVAGLTVGQDISDRMVQFAAGGQFSLGKSFTTYGPTGPWMVTPDEVENPDDLALGCSIDGVTVQEDRTSGLVFGVPRLLAELSQVVDLLPGDLVFTGTPAGVGIVQQPPRFLSPGETITSWVEGIGSITNHVIAGEG